jgi:DNA-binding NarL/FixJ family response regulator
MEQKIKIYIVDDNQQFLEGVKFMLKKIPAFEVIGSARNGEELLSKSTYKYADIILMDIEMPGLSGFELAKKVNWVNANIRLIAITMYKENVYMEKLVSSGFRGFVNKVDISVRLTEVIYKVMDNNFVFPHDIEIK